MAPAPDGWTGPKVPRSAHVCPTPIHVCSIPAVTTARDGDQPHLRGWTLDLADHYVAVSRIMPVLVVTGTLKAYDDHLARQALQLMLEQSDQIMAIKDDRGAPFVHKTCLKCHPRCTVFAGGSKLLQLGMVPFGCDGCMSTFVTFKTELAARYFNAVAAQDFATARQIIDA